MKQTMLVLLTAFALVGCNKDKEAVDTNKDATKDALNSQKDAVNAAAKDAKKEASDAGISPKSLALRL